MSLKNPVTPPGIDPGTVRLVAQQLNHYASPGPHIPKFTVSKLSAINNRVREKTRSCASIIQVTSSQYISQENCQC